MINKKNIFKIFLTIIFIIFIFFRFYNLDKRIGFDWDQEKFSSEIKGIVIDHKLTLIGPRTNNDLGFYLGPYFNYLLSPFYYVTNGHPIAMYYFLIVFNILFFIVMFKTIKKVFDEVAALLFAFWWSINYLIISYDTTPWWPVLIPLGVIISWFLLKNIYKKNLSKHWFLLGMCIGFFMNMHFQFIFIGFFTFVFLILKMLEDKKIYFKKSFYYIFGIAVMFLPLLLFDLRHNFLDSKLFLEFFFGKTSQANADRNIWWTVYGNFLQSFIYFKTEIIAIFFNIIFIFLLIVLILRNKDFNKLFFKSLLGLWLIVPLFFMIYGKRPSEYYFVFLLPFILITFISFFRLFKKQGLLLVFICIIFLLTFSNLKSIYKDINNGLYQKNLLVKKIKQIAGDKKIDIYINTDIGRNYGFLYLINYYKINQYNSPYNPHFEIIFPSGKYGKDDFVFGAFGLKVPKKI